MFDVKSKEVSPNQEVNSTNIIAQSLTALRLFTLQTFQSEFPDSKNQFPDLDNKTSLSYGFLGNFPFINLGFSERIKIAKMQLAIRTYISNSLKTESGLSLSKYLVLARKSKKMPEGGKIASLSTSIRTIYKTIDRHAISLNLSEEMTNFYRKVYRGILDRVKAVNFLCCNYNGEDVYEKIFKTPPQGKVEIIQGAYTLHLRCLSVIDYARALHLLAANKTPTKEQIERSNSSIAFALFDKAHSCHHLSNIITVERNSRNLPFAGKQVDHFIHEEEHQYISQFTDPGCHLASWYLNDFGINTEKNLMAFEADLRIYREIYADYLAKQEVLCYYIEGKSLASVKHYVRSDNKENYNYQKTMREKLAKVLDTTIDLKLYPIYEKVFCEEFDRNLQNAIDAVESLDKKVDNRGVLVEMLTPLPMAAWPDVAKQAA